MRASRIISATIAIFLSLAACNNADSIRISGTYSGYEADYLHINKIDVDQMIYLDSVKISKSGSFRYKLASDLPEYYSLGFNSNEFISIIAYPGDDIIVEFKGSSLQDDYTVKGSKESEDLRMLDKKLSQTLASMDSLTIEYDKLAEGEEFDNKRNELENSYTSLIEEQRMHNIKYIIENINSFASIKALYQRLDENAFVLYKTTDAQYLKLVSDTLNAHYPKSKQAISLANNLESELNQLNLNKINSLADTSTVIDMDINLISIEGKKVKLSSFRDKSYVLLSFWSAQSKECIANNIQMKEYYNLFKRKGFEIYQVNVDADENAWRQAVRFDDLPWISVREDDASNPINAMKYNVSSVPANYLIDKNGDIIGKNLFGRSLQIKLNQVFN